LRGWLAERAPEENRDEIEVRASGADVPVAGFVDFPRSGEAIVEISNKQLP